MDLSTDALVVDAELAGVVKPNGEQKDTKSAVATSS